jgi:hypothetical protein
MLALLAALMAADIGTREPSPQVFGATRSRVRALDPYSTGA